MNYEEFKEFINNSHAIVLFTASNCEPCIKVKKLIEDYGPFKGYNFKIINIDDNKKFAVKEQIFKVPTLKMYEDGELDYTLTGVHDIENYVKSKDWRHYE